VTDNNVPQFVACGLEIGNCPRQIPYNMTKHEKIIREMAIDEYRDKLINKMQRLWKVYEADTDNVPEPNFMCAYILADLISDQLKEDDNG